MRSTPAAGSADVASIVRGDGEAAFVILFADDDVRAGFSGPVADHIGKRPDCRVAIVAPDTAAIDPAAMAELLRARVPEQARVLMIGHGANANIAAALAAELGAALLLVAPVEPRDHRVLETRARAAGIAITTSEQAVGWLAQVATLDLHRMPLPGAALPIALRQSGTMADILGAMIDGLPLPDLSGSIADWHRRHGYGIELADSVQRSVSGELHLHGRIANTGEAPLHFGRRQPDRLLIGARARTGRTAAWTIEARAMPTQAVLAPGASAGFFIRFAAPPSNAEDDVEIELSLVAEGVFWYCDLGFPRLRLATASSLDGDPPAFPPQPAKALPASAVPVNECATLDDLSNCYRLILGRTPDPDGFSYFSQLLQTGMTVDELVSIFVTSPEARARFVMLGRPASPTAN
ncbi:hypothetical protein CVN68_21670 [Sphingomonas psychrotolerans]|uniref:DUF4214 domain-containing protein n=1 Tax=Sphingomonas psychrotolerans TaxID=1327635 RepID=A0A2K8MND3_9SPHN|nr:hypothetical protein CVN68_21670 [Sphingomonas psychrotolerans]